MKKIRLTFAFIAFAATSFAQFAGPAETPGSTAMHRDSSDFIAWATSAQLQLGLMDIANVSSGTTSSGDATSPTGFPDGNCISLGDSGVAILTFAQPIMNGNGPDFAVFENAFSDQFLELAFVEVSSDGVNFHRFPAISNTQTENQIGPFDAQGDATLLYNLAGKYRANYGTPFDLEELNGTFGLNVDAITHVKIIDVVGMINGNHVQNDSNGNPVNDPYATAFPSGGFDLDAIGVIHQAPVGMNEKLSETFAVYPNPATSNGIIHISTESELEFVQLITVDGEEITKSTSTSISIGNVPSGIYFVQIHTSEGAYSSKIIIQ